MSKITPEEIDALLPQTQCGLCGFGGCLPYAEALAKKTTTINLCPPGGMEGLLNLSRLLNIDAEPYLEDMQKKSKPPLLAIIREEDCIGCTKCIQACPVDAIVGSAKSMHTVLMDECTGCELCLPPCPIDCIEMVATAKLPQTNHHFRTRFKNRNIRLKKLKENDSNKSLDKKAYLESILLRAKNKKICT